jgi:hypothetical protein
LAEEIRSECPILEELKLFNCEYDNQFDGRIVSSSIKRLDVEGCYTSYRRLSSVHAVADHADTWDYQPPTVNKVRANNLRPFEFELVGYSNLNRMPKIFYSSCPNHYFHNV